MHSRQSHFAMLQQRHHVFSLFLPIFLRPFVKIRGFLEVKRLL